MKKFIVFTLISTIIILTSIFGSVQESKEVSNPQNYVIKVENKKCVEKGKYRVNGIIVTVDKGTYYQVYKSTKTMIKSMPKSYLQGIDEIYLSPKHPYEISDPDDPKTPQRVKDEPHVNGLWTAASTVRIIIRSSEDLATISETLAHEIMHNVDGIYKISDKKEFDALYNSYSHKANILKDNAALFYMKGGKDELFAYIAGIYYCRDVKGKEYKHLMDNYPEICKYIESELSAIY